MYPVKTILKSDIALPWKSDLKIYILVGSSPLVEGVIFQEYYGLLESKLFIVLTKYISLKRSEYKKM